MLFLIGQSKTVMKPTFTCLVSTLFAALIVLGLILVEMPLSDPELFTDSIIETLAVAGGMILVGFGGAFWLRNVYKQHRTYRRVLCGVLGFPLLVIGIVGMDISGDSSTMPYLIFGVVVGLIDMSVGGYLFLGESVMGKD